MSKLHMRQSILSSNWKKGNWKCNEAAGGFVTAAAAAVEETSIWKIGTSVLHRFLPYLSIAGPQYVQLFRTASMMLTFHHLKNICEDKQAKITPPPKSRLLGIIFHYLFTKSLFYVVQNWVKMIILMVEIGYRSFMISFHSMVSVLLKLAPHFDISCLDFGIKHL